MSTKVTQGTRSGERLDAWIAAEKDGRRVLSQTEIKMWAGNAIGGLRLAEDADEATLVKGAARQWARIWNPQAQDFLVPNVRKVLKPMKPPASHEEWPIKPLACFWWLMRSRPTAGPWFTVEVGEAAKSPFAEVHVFSLTAYLLTLDDEVLSSTSSPAPRASGSGRDTPGYARAALDGNLPRPEPCGWGIAKAAPTPEGGLSFFAPTPAVCRRPSGCWRVW